MPDQLKDEAFAPELCKLAALLCLGVSSPCLAFWDPPYITPLSPGSFDPVYVNTTIGVCDVILGQEGFPRLVREGNQITITYYGQHWDPGELCIYPTGTEQDLLGTFETGTYSVSVVLDYYDFFETPQVLQLGEADFSVAGAEPRAVAAPTLSNIWGLLLAVLLVSIATVRVARTLVR
jgi:hypothetical protein